MAAPTQEQVTEVVVEAFIDLIQERKLAGKRELAATQETIADWLSDRTGLKISAAHVQVLTTAMRQAGLLSVGGFGIGKPNTYDTTEDEMGVEAYWNQVAAFLMVWRHPSRKAMLKD
ncbi:MAG TPA: hypothetical protein GXZ82_13570 [Firmicutes bacterium]|jgi:hypothetical protein|nr:hypothetical protein [Bacillota bacterium]